MAQTFTWDGWPPTGGCRGLRYTIDSIDPFQVVFVFLIIYLNLNAYGSCRISPNLFSNSQASSSRNWWTFQTFQGQPVEVGSVSNQFGKRKAKQTNKHTNKQTNKQTNKRTNERTKERRNKQTNKQTNEILNQIKPNKANKHKQTKQTNKWSLKSNQTKQSKQTQTNHTQKSSVSLSPSYLGALPLPGRAHQQWSWWIYP